MSGPSSGTPPRRLPSVRRTSSMDLLRPSGPAGPMVIAGRARDLLTAPAGQARVLATGLLSATIGTDGRVARLVTYPDGARAVALVGRPAGTGFRTAVWRTLREHYDSGTPLHLLLDEVPVGLVISGYAARRAAPRGLPRRGRRLDVCAGWASDGRAASVLSASGSPPDLATPGAPSLAVDDPRGWHTMAPLPVFA
ncbi:MAG TPA: hypothetical protein VHM65_06485, partial [Candidatus Lustribacter sp.]|nr:hypothetical protein [Candidatus Lustribacter sp.]